MDPKHWTRARALFERALELPSDQRAAFVDAAEDEDEGVRREAHRLLASERDGDLLAAPLDHLRERFEDRLPDAGDAVGPFRIERLLGRGGMGSVFLARQERPQRPVALKLMHVGLRSDDSRRRFEVEAEILGHLRHPAIATVHQVGVHAGKAGAEVPWFAMEYVEGARDLLHYAEDEQLPVEARVELMRTLCDAAHHAHQKGVVHRDLKPANVLVDSAGRLKVIDYGVARVTEPGIAPAFETRAGEVFGTLQYMSPEQLTGESADVDTRSDVYALGVILYELLTGRPPHELGRRSVTDAVREVCERVPSPPSLSAPRTPRELDWITLKALEKERERRYASAAELGADLQRFARGEPVLAGPPTARYRASKFVRRHRLAVGAASALLVTLVAGVVATSLGLAAAEEARAAEAEQKEAALVALRREQGVVEAVGEMLSAVAPDRDGRKVTLYELLERKVPTLDEELGDDPEVRAALQRFLAGAYTNLGLLEEAAQLAAAAVDTLEVLPDADPIELNGMRVFLGRRLLEQGRFDEAAAQLDAARAGFAAAGVERSVHTVAALRLEAMVRNVQGRPLEAVAAYTEAEELARELLGADSVLELVAAADRALLLSSVGQNGEALRVARDAYARARAALPPGDPTTLQLALRLSKILQLTGHAAEALALQREILARGVEVYGEHHRNVMQMLSSLAVTLSLTGEHEEALELAHEALDIAVEYHASDLDAQALTRTELATVLQAAGRLGEAADHLTEVVELVLAAGRPNHPIGMVARVRLGRTLLQLGLVDEGEEELLASYETLTGSPDEHLRGRAQEVAGFLAALYARQGREPERARFAALAAAGPR